MACIDDAKTQIALGEQAPGRIDALKILARIPGEAVIGQPRF